jgi:hypothetical protein
VSDDLENRVRSFLNGRIDSVEQLNILILLHLDAGRAWTVERITEELRSAQTSVTNRLKGLVSRGVLAPDALRNGEVLYVPLDREVAALISDTIALYRSMPYRVRSLLCSTPKSPFESLADAVY